MQKIWLPDFVDYQEALRLQEDFVTKRQQDPNLDHVLLLLEHKPVYTIGRTRDLSSLKGGASHLPYPVYETNRGGQATYHGPGQLVGYPITNLALLVKDLHSYVTGIEQTLIRTCDFFGIKAAIREGLVGIWVKDRKLASIGVGIKKWITMHGFAMNITMDSLPPFLNITPCGLDNVKMTCLEAEMSHNGLSIPNNLLKKFGDQFAELWEQHCYRIKTGHD